MRATHIALIALCLCAGGTLAQPSEDAEPDSMWDYPETIIRAEGAREMSVMAAAVPDLAAAPEPYRVIVRFPRTTDLGDAVERLMATPVAQLAGAPMVTAATVTAASAGGGPTLGALGGVRVVKRLRGGGVRGVALELPASIQPASAVAGLRLVEGVEDVEAEGVVTVALAQVSAAGVPRDAPLGLLRTGLATLEGGTLKVQPTVVDGGSVGVAIIDTGVDSGHPDISLAGGHDFTADGDFGLDGNGHGTHVAGIIGALNNGAGVVGALPGAPIWSLKVLSAAGQGTTTSVIDALNWVADNGRARGIRVVNMSLSGPRSRMMCDALKAVTLQGITVVAAAGNNGLEITSGSPSDCSAALIVTAMADYDGRPGGKAQVPRGPGAPTTPDDATASFSNYALTRSTRVVCAPGVHVLSTVPAARCGPLKCAKAGPYAYLSGTSMAAPLVSGMAALCYNAGPCAPARGSAAATLAAAFAAAARSDRGSGFAGDPLHGPTPRRYVGYLARNVF